MNLQRIYLSFKNTTPFPVFKVLTIDAINYIYTQWRIQDFAQGGDKTGAKRPKICLSPPWANSVPPLNHSGGGHFCCPPPELLRRGTILRGGTVPPWNCSGGGQSPIPPPCIRSCIYIYGRIPTAPFTLTRLFLLLFPVYFCLPSPSIELHFPDYSVSFPRL